MQQLTARGIRLAKELRSKGLPVIESYPGAAQDIMGIPRKRAGLEYLKGGLAAFGISGKFLDAKVSHDEVDAVTSAAVGLFFWSGKFEALGNEEEEFLIVPDLEIRPGPWRRRAVIGTSGSIASGKTTGARFIETKGSHMADIARCSRICFNGRANGRLEGLSRLMASRFIGSQGKMALPTACPAYAA